MISFFFFFFFFQALMKTTSLIFLLFFLPVFCCFFCFLFFFSRTFILWFTGQQGKREAISLTPLHHFESRHRHLEIRSASTAESSPLHIASSWTWKKETLVSERKFRNILFCRSVYWNRLFRALCYCTNILFPIAKKTQQKQLCFQISFPFRYFSCCQETLGGMLTTKNLVFKNKLKVKIISWEAQVVLICYFNSFFLLISPQSTLISMYKSNANVKMLYRETCWYFQSHTKIMRLN